MHVKSFKSVVKCRLLEDNESCINIVEAPILTLRSKHAAFENHYFRRNTEKGIASLESIRTGDQTSDVLTKPVPRPQLTYMRKKLNENYHLRGSVETLEQG